MKRTVSFWVVLGTLQLMLGCAGTKVTSVRDYEFTGSIQRLYVLIDHKSVQPQQVSGFDTTLCEALSGSGRVLKWQTVRGETEGLTLEPKTTVDTSDISAFGPDAVLVVEAIAAKYTDHGLFGKSLNAVTYDVSLYATGREKRIWHGEAEVKLSLFSGLKAAARSIAQQLRADGLI
jgi:hypothetical protein